VSVAPVFGLSRRMLPAFSNTNTRPLPSGTGARKSGWLKPVPTRLTRNASWPALVTVMLTFCVTVAAPSLTEMVTR